MLCDWNAYLPQQHSADVTSPSPQPYIHRPGLTTWFWFRSTALGSAGQWFGFGFKYVCENRALERLTTTVLLSNLMIIHPSTRLSRYSDIMYLYIWYTCDSLWLRDCASSTKNWHCKTLYLNLQIEGVSTTDSKVLKGTDGKRLNRTLRSGSLGHIVRRGILKAGKPNEL